MSQHYSNPERETEDTALPDVEVFEIRDVIAETRDGEFIDEQGLLLPIGWYYWFCFPGCLPDSDAVGPFATEAEALADAQSNDE